MHTSPQARPKPAWLNFVVTNKARNNIRHYLKNLHTGEAVLLGKRLLDSALAHHSSSLKEVGDLALNTYCKELKIENIDVLFEQIGLGESVAELTAGSLLKGKAAAKKQSSKQKKMALPIAIDGTEGVVVNYAKCCHPIPGDAIFGVISSGKGLVIHRETCHNINHKKAATHNVIALTWSSASQQVFVVEVRVLTVNERGVLATLAARIASADSNIENIVFEEKDGASSTITISFDVRNRKHLADIIRTLRSVPSVYKVTRTRG